MFTLEEALGLVAERGRLMESLPRGAMLAVRSRGGGASCRCSGRRLSLAAVNGPGLCVASGPRERSRSSRSGCGSAEWSAGGFATSHAFHSAMMEPILERFRERVAQAQPRGAGASLRLERDGGLDHGRRRRRTRSTGSRHLRSCVRFADGVGRLLPELEGGVLLEVGPGQTLTTLAGSGRHAGAA